MRTFVDEKSAFAILQLRLHCSQKKQAPRSVVLLIFFVRIESLEGITFTFACSAARLIKSSCKRGLGGGRKTPSGSFSSPSFVPNIYQLINSIIIRFDIII